MEQAPRDRGWPWEAGHDRQIFFAVAWMAVGGVLTLVGCLLLFFLGVTVGVVTGFLPGVQATPGSEVSWRIRGFLREQRLIEKEETLIYFGSHDLSSVSEDGSLFTDRRVIRYHEDPGLESGLTVCSAEYAGIASIEPVFGSGRDATSVIRVTPKEGEAFDLLVSNEESRDRAFAQRLRETWEKAR